MSRKQELGMPAMAAGHSVGEFAALAFAEVFSFEDGLKMVAKSGQIMSEITGVAWLPLSDWTRLVSLKSWTRKVLRLLTWPILIPPGQIVISGPAAEIAEALAPIKEAGAKLVVPLKVSGAFTPG